ncbi:MAG: hypothetical protein ACXW03_04260 [Methylobacter sp.]
MSILSGLINKKETYKTAPIVAEVASTSNQKSKSTNLASDDIKSANLTMPAPIPEIKPEDRAAILRWLHYIGENSQPIIDDVLDCCVKNKEVLQYYLARAREVRL